MAAPFFGLKDRSNPAHIIMYYRYAPNVRLKYYTGERCSPSKFSPQNLISRSVAGSAKSNEYLRHLSRIAMDVGRQMRIDGKLLSPHDFKTQIDISIGKTELGVYLYDYMDQDYERRLKHAKANSVRRYKSQYNKIRTVIPNRPLNEINKSIIERGMEKLIDESLSPKYVNKLISQLLTLLRTAAANGHETSADIDHVKLMRAKSKDQIFCTLDELERMHRHKYSSPRLRNAVNIFLIGAFTSMRVSEYMLVAADPDKHIYNINGKKIIKILASAKTKKRVAIPMHWIIEDILHNYDLRPISDQRLNDYIKEAAKEIGIDDTFTRIEYRGRKEVECSYPKYKLISSHTARRSFITIMYMMGVDEKIIRMFSTHSTERQLLQYVRLDAEMNAVRMADHPFFTRPDRLRIVK